MLVIALDYFTNSNLSIIIIKWWVASIKLKCNAPNSPHVIAAIAWLLHHDFRSCVV